MFEDAPSYLRKLVYLRHNYPRAAVEEAVEKRGEVVPFLLEGIGLACDDPELAFAGEDEYMLHIFALYLLAQFREEKALPLFLRFARLPEIHDLLGDTLTEDFFRMLAAVSGSGTGPLEELVTDPDADEYARAAAFGAIEMMHLEGRLPTGWFEGYVKRLFESLPRSPDFIWDVLTCACGEHGFTWSLDLVRGVFENGFVDPSYCGLEWIEKTAASGGDLKLVKQRARPITDTVEETRGWAYLRDGGDLYGPPAPPYEAPPKIGRNDPCPCGSGKKYKKCCLV